MLATHQTRLKRLNELLLKIETVPEDWLAGRTAKAAKSGGSELELIPCTSYKELVKQWSLGMKWTDGLDQALSTMLACAASTSTPEELLWCIICGPPSCGKTTLVEGIGASRKWAKTVGTFTGLHSGAQTDKTGEEDNSLMALIKDKTLIIKDADPLLKSPNRDQILSELRDAYDTNTAPTFRNKIKRDYRSHRFTVIKCGTAAMFELDASELGARFVNCIIMHEIDEEFETAINNRVVARMFRNRGYSANGAAAPQTDAQMLRAKQMTAGYVDYLRKNASDLLGALDVETNIDALMDGIDKLAQFVAFLRARPAKKQEEATTREMSARLTAQFSKLAMCYAIVMNRPCIDAEVMRRVRQRALDTAFGRTLDIAKHLYAAGHPGLESRGVAAKTNHDEVKERVLLSFMVRIGAVQSFYFTKKGQRTGAKRYRLTDRMRRLYERATMTGGDG